MMGVAAITKPYMYKQTFQLDLAGKEQVRTL